MSILRKANYYLMMLFFGLGNLYLGLFFLLNIFSPFLKALSNIEFIDSLFLEESAILPALISLVFLIYVSVSSLLFYRKILSKRTVIITSLSVIPPLMPFLLSYALADISNQVFVYVFAGTVTLAILLLGLTGIYFMFDDIDCFD